jgi:molybdopterin synthase sulfur carrier subunit
VTVRVRYFASLTERTGCSAETVEVDPGTDVAALWSRLTGQHPRLAEIAYRPLVALDLVYAAWSDPLDGVREVAFLPPVSGG